MNPDAATILVAALFALAKDMQAGPVDIRTYVPEGVTSHGMVPQVTLVGHHGHHFTEFDAFGMNAI